MGSKTIFVTVIVCVQSILNLVYNKYLKFKNLKDFAFEIYNI